VQPNERISSAVNILQRYYSSIVFCRTRRGCDRVAKQFAKKGIPAVAIHGDRSQGQRERALRDFTSGKAQVLVATDVAARGIHVDNVALVMHYDPAGSDKDYIHRSGRTGRAGQDGRVISMVVEDKKKMARALQKDLGLKPGFDDLVEDGLPDTVERPAYVPEPEPARQKKGGGKSRNRDGGNRGGSRDRDDDRNRGGSRDRDDDRNRNGRDDERRGGRRNTRGSQNRNRNDRDDRDGGNRRPRRRSGSNDWYPPGYEDDRDGRGKRSGKKSSSKSSSGRGGSNRNDKDERDDRPGGGSGTTRRKNRSTKGRHADQGASKNKGKRRNPRTR